MRVNGRKTLQAVALGLVLALVTFSLVGCGDSLDCLTVSEVWQNAESLDGKRACVRGQAYLEFIPYHPWVVGGCPADGAATASIRGRLRLYDVDFHGSRHERPEIKVSASSLHCEGNACGMVCKPFAPTLDLSAGYIQAFEFVGILKVDTQESQVVLILEEIDLTKSRRLVNGNWEPIPTGEFEYPFLY